MYFFIIVILISSLDPYFRKYILKDYNSHDYLVLNYLFLFIVSLFLLIGKIIQNTNYSQSIFHKIKNINILDGVIFFIMAVSTILFDVNMFNYDVFFNTPALNSVLVFVLYNVFVFLIGFLLFSEKHTLKQNIGLLLSIPTIYLLL